MGILQLNKQSENRKETNAKNTQCFVLLSFLRLFDHDPNFAFWNLAVNTITLSSTLSTVVLEFTGS